VFARAPNSQRSTLTARSHQRRWLIIDEKRRAAGLVSISLASARARGRKGGRPAKLPAKQVCSARKMAEPRMTIKEVAEAFGVNRATIYRSFGLGSYAKGATGDAA
jgi:hypothetical protein